LGDPVAVGPDTVRIGYVGRGATSCAALWLASPGDDTVYTADGRTLDTATERPHGFVPVAGLASFHCDVAAALFTCASAVMPGLGGNVLEATLVPRRLGVGVPGPDGAVDVPRTRRTAAELAAAGCDGALDLLPLSTGERHWWGALAQLRVGDRTAVAQHLAQLPLNGYAPALLVLRWAVQRWVGEAATTARYLLDQRLQGSANQKLARVSLACGATPLVRFLLDPSVPLPPELAAPPAASTDSPATGRSPAIDRALALRGATMASPVAVGPSVTAAVLDDLIDLHVPLDPATLSDEQRRHVLARSQPEELSDRDVDLLGLSFERDRRRLAAGQIDEIVTEAADAHVRGIVHLANEGVVGDDLRAVDPVVAEHLEAFLASPSPTTLTADLVADATLWPLLARRLDVPLWNWKLAPEAGTQRFVGWMALRASFDRLVEGNWVGALETATQAARLAADDDQRREALNMIAFAHWQRDDAVAARDALASVTDGTDVSVQVNLAIVAASLDPMAAAAELARLIRESTSSELRAAAAMRAVHQWWTDDLPWTVRRRRDPPAALVEALRELVLEPIDLGVFRAVLLLLSNVDRDWVARPARLSASPRRGTLEVRIAQARATGPRELVDAFSYALRSPEPPEWLGAERDRSIEIAVRSVFDDDGSSALFAMFALERKLPMEPRQRALLAPLAVLAACEHHDPTMEPPGDGYRRLLVDAEHEWRVQRPSTHVLHLMDTAWERLAQTHVQHLDIAVDRMVRDVENLARRLRNDSRARRNTAAVRSVVEPILEDAIAADDALSEFRSRISASALAHDVDELLQTVRDIRRAAMRLM
jgi:hypothetical protein